MREAAAGAESETLCPTEEGYLAQSSHVPAELVLGQGRQDLEKDYL